MSDTSPGVVVVTTFCDADQKYFSGFISYIDRPEAVRKAHVEKFDIFSGYMDYMGNPEKSLGMDFEKPEKISGLFTTAADTLSQNEIKDLKETFKEAQSNGSLMWQTVISFDNDWLQKMGVYDKDVLDEKRMRNAARRAVNKMLEKEGLQNGVWAASFHYNTDNIHVHISTVEPVPMRRKKRYKQYEVVQVDGKWQYKKERNPKTGRLERIPILDAKGNIVEKEEYVGRFKESSIAAAKSTIVSELMNDKTLNREINQLIRDRLVQSMKAYILYDDEEFRTRFLELYEKLPENKGVCNYGNSAMAKLRPEIDDLTDLYIAKYHRDDFEALQAQIEAQKGRYQAAYGGSDNDFAKNKMDDLYYRMGNAILRELKAYDKTLKEDGISRSIQQEESALSESEMNTDFFEASFEDDKNRLVGELNEADDADTEDLWVDSLEDDEIGPAATMTQQKQQKKKYYIDWKKGYGDARDLIYIKREYEKAIEGLESLCRKGNVLAISEMGNIYHFGRGTVADEEIAQTYYKEALDGFFSLLEDKTRYCSYRIGKQYLYGQGAEQDYENAAKYLQRAADSDHSYAMYLMGNLYLQGQGVPRDAEKAIEYYEAAAQKSNPYAQYKLGQLYERGEITEKDAEKSNENYAAALKAFLEVKGKDENMLYRIGTMYLKGRGTPIDYKSAAKFLESAATLRNLLAVYQLGRLYLMEDNPEKNYEKGIEYLTVAAENENVEALYQLGQIYEAGDIVEVDKEKTDDYYRKALERYLKKAEDDDTVCYRIGTMYLNGKGTEINYGRAVSYFQKAAERDNAQAMYQLGKIYERGKEGVPRNAEKALRYFTEAAVHGNGFAAFKAAQFYEFGIGTLANMEKAHQYYHTALQFFEQMESDELLSYRIGTMYLEGKGTQVDYDKAIMHFQDAADLGSAYASYKLGQIYEQEEAVPTDQNMAQKYYAAALNRFVAMEEKSDEVYHRIGTMYLKGRGTEINYEKAASFFKAAAEQGNTMSMYQIGKLYTENYADQRTYDEGIKYLTSAAEGNNPYAQYSLGILAAKEGDRKAAERWLGTAAANGNTYAATALYSLQHGNGRSMFRYRTLRTSGEDLQRAMYWLDKSMRNVLEHYLNQQAHDQLEQEIALEHGIELD